MRRFLIVWRRELESSFLSPAAYVIMVIFLALTGWVFLQLVEGHVGEQEPLAELLYKVLIYFWMPVLVTVVTMRLFSEEKRAGTLEPLLTAPVTDVQVVLGKYAGALTFLLAVTAPAVAYPYVLAAMSPGIAGVEDGGMLAGGLFTMLLSAFCVAIGLVMSLLARSQVVSAICCFSGVLLPLLAGYMISLLPLGAESLVAYVTVHDHLLDATRGAVDSRPLVMYATGTVLLIFVAVKMLESRRWR